MTVFGSSLRQFWQWCVALLLAGCSGSQLGTDSALGADGKPAFDAPVPKLKPVQSRLSLRMRLSEASLSEELARAVPTVLAREKSRSMGAPGKVSYEVRRGGFTFDTSNDALLVRTQLVANISVCKPLGPLCLPYGACRPTWEVEVQVPTPLSLEHPPAPTLSLGLASGCILRPVGYDATSELRRVTHRQARQARAQMRDRIGTAYAQLVAAYRAAVEPRRFGTGEHACIAISPERLAQTPIKVVNEALQVGLQMDGTIRLDCATTPTAALPTTSLEPDILPETQLLVGYEVSFHDLNLALAEHDQAIELVSGRLAEHDVLYVNTAQGTPVWRQVIPVVKDDFLRLEPAEPTSQAVELVVPLPPDLVLAVETLEQTQAQLLARIQEGGAATLALEGELAPTRQVRVGPSSLQLIAGLQGVLSISQ